MVSEHPKITSYIPKDILEALDKWREEHELESRNAAIVTILADYLGVQYPVRLLNTAPLSIYLNTVLNELARLSQRMNAMKDSIGTVHEEVQSTLPIALSDAKGKLCRLESRSRSRGQGIDLGGNRRKGATVAILATELSLKSITAATSATPFF